MLLRTPSQKCVEIYRFFDPLEPWKRCSRVNGSFIFTFATNLEIASKWRSQNLLLGSLWAPKCINFGIWGHLKNYRKQILKNVRMYRKWVPKWVMPFVANRFVLETNFETLPQTSARTPLTPKIIDFSSKYHQTSHPKTNLSEFFLFPSQHLWRTWGPQDGFMFSHQRSLPFLLNLWEEPRSCTFYTLLGVRRCHDARRLQYYIMHLYTCVSVI